MPQKKQENKKTAAAAKPKSTAKKAVKKTAAPAAVPTVREKKEPNPSSIMNQLIPYILGIAALFITICLFSETAAGGVGAVIRKLLFGLLSYGAYAVPVLTVVLGVFWRRDVEKNSCHYKIVFFVIILIFISVLSHILTVEEGSVYDTYSLKALWQGGLERACGGVAGGLIGGLLLQGIGFATTFIISMLIVLVLGIFMFGLTPRALWIYIAYYIHEAKEKQAAINEEAEKKKVYAVKKERPVRTPRREFTMPEEQPLASPKKERFVADLPVDDPQETAPASVGASAIDTSVFDEIEKEEAEKAAEETLKEAESVPETITPIARAAAPSEKKSGLDLEEIFAGEERLDLVEKYNSDSLSPAEDAEADIGLEVERGSAVDDTAPWETPFEEEEDEYLFPPITLLAKPEPASEKEGTEELRQNAEKLVETLNSFKVRTRIVNVSRGPTITRYELTPEDGIRVRAIANLVDDIALKLATTGVRIEAPIPGKAAVGIEVPNKKVSIVSLRELIENDKFAQAQSKVTVCLGMDVAGTPIYTDIAKMPHLLIAGATGMGKSVCINSMIVSLLYKATPDEVKLILIDPKKVELNIYSGLPHLLVPVVSDPKKAAGALHWAVTEMERRFELIEDVGVRDLKGYNKITADDPSREKLPHIVIIIDELADLMMTAPDEVEESICRLAQKARAAGMHLIIGTQRPSVDVITGLIKANVPSRIAFTVASQVDSRTIIDITGAEKLIGRGDMLYAPVGASKPIRVQGSFVSESEIEAVVGFIRSNEGDSEYNSEVIEKIEKEAQRCGQPKKAAFDDGDDGEEEDPMLKAAIELAVDSGKISTSLIQRRLSLGYGRAAKLIDKMERMGIVSPPEGQKPRSVLISKQQFMEMVLNRDEI